MITTTVIRNPGIGNRLSKDICCFEEYGFSLEKKADGDDNNDSHDDVIFHSPDNPVSPIVSLRIQVSTNTALISSIGPYLRTLVRLCVDINPRSLQAIVVIENNKTINIRSIAHAIHMLIRNSMGAALFLSLHIVLPQGVSLEEVQKEMKQNDDGCYEYPTVIIHESTHGSSNNRGISSSINNNSANYFCINDIIGSTKELYMIDLELIVEKSNVPSIGNPLSQTCLEVFDPKRQYLSFNVKTRMCTIRFTPLLYHLSQLLMIRNHNTRRPSLSNEFRSSSPSLKAEQYEHHHPMIFICLEKLSNLYRVLMLVWDYSKDTKTIGHQFVVVCKSSDITERFQVAAAKFVSENFTSDEKEITVQVMSIDDALELLGRESVSVVGFDLHDDAMTLSNCKENTDGAKNVLRSAGAIILGFESDTGIPESFYIYITEYVQIQSRTSINVVAAFSIALHLIASK